MGAVSPAQALPFASGSVTYDAAGNVWQDAFNKYTYDSQNHLIASQSLSTGSLTCYFYDAYGRRVQKVDAATSCGYPISGGTSLYYVYDVDGNVIDEVSAPSGGTGNWTRQEIYAGSRHLATFSASTGQAYWDFTDWLGTERARASAVTAAVVETCTSLPWGDNLQCTGTDQSPLHFTGKQRDSESGLDNFEARYLASSFGRFISPDLMGGDITDPQTLNRYVYVRDNPLNLIDPSGLDPQSAQNCIYSIYSGATATDCYPSSAGDDQIAQNQGQNKNQGPTQIVPADCEPPQCKFIQVHVNQKAPDACPTSDATCYHFLRQILPRVELRWLQTRVFFSALGQNFVSEFKEGGCVNAGIEGAENADFLGFLPPNAVSPEETIKGASATAAARYAAEQGLTVPLRSSLVRGVLQTGERAAGTFTAGYGLYVVGAGAVAEGEAMARGTCH